MSSNCGTIEPPTCKLCRCNDRQQSAHSRSSTVGTSQCRWSGYSHKAAVRSEFGPSKIPASRMSQVFPKRDECSMRFYDYSNSLPDTISLPIDAIAAFLRSKLARVSRMYNVTMIGSRSGGYITATILRARYPPAPVPSKIDHVDGSIDRTNASDTRCPESHSRRISLDGFERELPSKSF